MSSIGRHSESMQLAIFVTEELANTVYASKIMHLLRTQTNQSQCNLFN